MIETDFNQRKKLERTEPNLHFPSLTNLSCVKKTPDFGVSDDVIPNRLLPISFSSHFLNNNSRRHETKEDETGEDETGVDVMEVGEIGVDEM